MPFNNEVPSYESLLEFQEVYLLAVAVSWKDEVFKKKLLDNPMSALEHYFGYKCPWNITLKVTDIPNGGPHKYGWDNAKGKWHLPVNSITFGLPMLPERDEEVCIALASYNDAGPTYLFTCC